MRAWRTRPIRPRRRRPPRRGNCAGASGARRTRTNSRISWQSPSLAGAESRSAGRSSVVESKLHGGEQAPGQLAGGPGRRSVAPGEELELRLTGSAAEELDERGQVADQLGLYLLFPSDRTLGQEAGVAFLGRGQ